MGGGQQPGKFFAKAVEQLCAYAEAEFRAGRKLADGSTERDHAAAGLRQLEKLGKRPKKVLAIDGPEFPDGLDHIWKWFCEVSLGIEAGGMGPQVVTWDNVRSWAALMRTEPEPWEALLLVRLGYIRATVLSEKPKPGEA